MRTISRFGGDHAADLPADAFLSVSKTDRTELSAAAKVGNRRILVLRPEENTIQMPRPDGAWMRCDGPSLG
jgi:hypothetical protein